MGPVPLSNRHAAELGKEWEAHHEALRFRDPRLVRTRELAAFFETEIRRSVEGMGLAYGLRDEAGWRALAVGSVLRLRDNDPAQEIIFRDSIGWRVLLFRPLDTLSAPDLFAALDRAGRSHRVEMMYATIPSADVETIAFVARHGYEPSYVHCARYEPIGLPPEPPPGVTIRQAQPGEGVRIVERHLEELEYHALCAPTQRTEYPGRVERQTEGCEELIRDPSGLSLYAEHKGEVIAVADGRIGFTHLRTGLMLPETQMGFIRSVGTAAEWRGKGIGTALSLALASEMEQRGVQRWELVYCPWNPLSSRFWPKLKFLPVAHGFCKRPSPA